VAHHDKQTSTKEAAMTHAQVVPRKDCVDRATADAYWLIAAASGDSDWTRIYTTAFEVEVGPRQLRECEISVRRDGSVLKAVITLDDTPLIAAIAAWLNQTFVGGSLTTPAWIEKTISVLVTDDELDAVA
jgi:hypothetical protein